MYRKFNSDKKNHGNLAFKVSFECKTHFCGWRGTDYSGSNLFMYVVYEILPQDDGISREKFSSILGAGRHTSQRKTHAETVGFPQLPLDPLQLGVLQPHALGYPKDRGGGESLRVDRIIHRMQSSVINHIHTSLDQITVARKIVHPHVHFIVLQSQIAIPLQRILLKCWQNMIVFVTCLVFHSNVW